MRALFPERTPHFETTEWPWWTGIAAAAIPTVVSVLAMIQRGVSWPPSWPLIWILVALSPWLVEAAGIVLPRWLFAMVVVGAYAVLVTTQDPPPFEGIGSLRYSDTLPFLLVFLAGEMAARGGLRDGLAVAVPSVAVVALMDLRGYEGYWIWILAIGIGLGTGFFMGKQFQLMAELRNTQEALAEKAVTEERGRIAREVHDVVAHTLTVTMLHMTAARMALERGDDDGAAEALGDAERLGRQSLADIRRTVGLLGPGSATAPPAPNVSDVATLVDDFSSAGLEVRFDADGLDGISGATGLVLYRIAQESLANAAKHAPGAAVAMRLRGGDTDVRIEVRNRLPAQTDASDGGHGVEGMRERAAGIGGRLEAGPKGTEWVVDATLPAGVADAGSPEDPGPPSGGGAAWSGSCS